MFDPNRSITDGNDYIRMIIDNDAAKYDTQFKAFEKMPYTYSERIF